MLNNVTKCTWMVYIQVEAPLNGYKKYFL